MDEVENFINRRWKGTDAKWFNGNCYWFAKILTDRFSYLNIYYDPIDGHFVAGNGMNYYDASGKIKKNIQPMLLDDIKKDELWYFRLMRDCAY